MYLDLGWQRFLLQEPWIGAKTLGTTSDPVAWKLLGSVVPSPADRAEAQCSEDQ